MNFCAMLEKKSNEMTQEQKDESEKTNALVATKKEELEALASTVTFTGYAKMNVETAIMRIRMHDSKFVTTLNTSCSGVKAPGVFYTDDEVESIAKEMKDFFTANDVEF